MHRVFETNDPHDANRVVETLRSAGMEVFLSGEQSKSLPGLYVPNVLAVHVFTEEHALKAKGLVEMALRSETTRVAEGVVPSGRKPTVWATRFTWIAIGVGVLLVALGQSRIAVAGGGGLAFIGLWRIISNHVYHAKR